MACEIFLDQGLNLRPPASTGGFLTTGPQRSPLELLYTAQEVINCFNFGDEFWQYMIRLKRNIYYNAAILCLDLDPEKLLPGTQGNPYKNTNKKREKKTTNGSTVFFVFFFLVALFLIAKDWKPPQCQPRKEIINCSMVTHEPELHILTQRNPTTTIYKK